MFDSHFCLQPVFSPSVLAEMTRPDGSSTVPVLVGETLSSELAHELLGIQVSTSRSMFFCLNVIVVSVLWFRGLILVPVVRCLVAFVSMCVVLDFFSSCITYVQETNYSKLLLAGFCKESF